MLACLLYPCSFQISILAVPWQAPIVFAKACEIFILELTLRSWIQTEDNKRRTLQRADVTNAVAKNDVFDFLIDILPQRGEDGKGAGKRTVDVRWLFEE